MICLQIFICIGQQRQNDMIYSPILQLNSNEERITLFCSFGIKDNVYTTRFVFDSHMNRKLWLKNKIEIELSFSNAIAYSNNFQK